MKSLFLPVLNRCTTVKPLYDDALQLIVAGSSPCAARSTAPGAILSWRICQLLEGFLVGIWQLQAQGTDPTEEDLWTWTGRNIHLGTRKHSSGDVPFWLHQQQYGIPNYVSVPDKGYALVCRHE